jgi:hypothetical protein
LRAGRFTANLQLIPIAMGWVAMVEIDEPDGQIHDLIDEGHALLERLKNLESQASDLAWESVVELQELVNRMRHLRPPKPFLSKSGLA